LAVTILDTSVDLQVITSAAQDQVMTAFYEIINDYASPYPTGSIRTDYIQKNTMTQAGVAGTPSIILRSVGLASKPIISNDTVYMLATYGESNQPTYFLIDMDGNIFMR